MPRKYVLPKPEYEKFIAFPDGLDEIIHYYTLSETDIAIIRQHRGNVQRFGFAFLLCSMRYPGIVVDSSQSIPVLLGEYLGKQLNISPEAWVQYGKRTPTRREHLQELQKIFGFATFKDVDYTMFLSKAEAITAITDKPLAVAGFLVESMRDAKILLPSHWTINQLCAEALTTEAKSVYEKLTGSLTQEQAESLDKLLKPDEEHRSLSKLAWIASSPLRANPKNILMHIERLKTIENLKLPKDAGSWVHRNWLVKLSGEGRHMTAQHLRDFETVRRRATLLAVCLELNAVLIDEIIELHDRFIRHLWSAAQRKSIELLEKNGQSAGQVALEFSKVIKALLKAREDGQALESAIENITTWEELTQTSKDAEKILQPQNFNYLVYTKNSYSVIRKYAPALLDSLRLRSRPPHNGLLDALDLLKKMNSDNSRKLPDDAPTDFVSKKWQSLVIGVNGIDRSYYELCVLSELKNALRSGDIWVEGSNLYRDFENYLLPRKTYHKLKTDNSIPVAIETVCERYLNERLNFLTCQLSNVATMARKEELEDAVVTKRGFKITPLERAIPDDTKELQRRIYALLPRIKITDLLLEVNLWTGFSDLFRHAKSEATCPDKLALLSVILGDGLNLGLRKMSESCPGMTYQKLSWTSSWYVREEAYSAALASLVDAQHALPFARNWGDGTTSSSDGQRFPTGWQGSAGGEVNLKYGAGPGKVIYTHISDQSMPFHTKVVSPVRRDAVYVLDGLLYHNSNLNIEEHYTDTAGFTDHIFAMMHFLGFRFAPRIRDFVDKKLYIPKNYNVDPIFEPMVGGRLNTEIIQKEWDEILRLHASLRMGTVTASVILHKLNSYQRQNSLNRALKELGRIERTLFMLDWISNKNLRRRVQIGLNKGEARNFLARSMFEHRNGEIRDRTLANQQNRASGLSLMIGAIGLWNTVYIERAVNMLEKRGEIVDKELLRHISPLGWEHIALNGDFIWRHPELKQGEFRPLRNKAVIEEGWVE